MSTEKSPISNPDIVTYYDVRLVELTDKATLVLEYQANRLELATFQVASDWLKKHIGEIGIVEYAPESQCWRFNPYLDQSLRRVFELDSSRDRIGWVNDANPGGWTAPRSIVPGENGAFIEDQTMEVLIDVPPEFFRLCRHYKREPEMMLRDFIADACGLASYVRNPRADGYSSNGSDERAMAVDYLDRAYGMFIEGNDHD